MARKTAIERFSAAIGELLEEYGEDVRDNMDEIVVEMGRQGAKALRSQSREKLGGTGKYARDWKYEIDRERTGSTAIVYNGKHYQLTHLLEHGHVTRNGTSRIMPDTPAHEHIAPIEDELAETFQQEVVDKL